MHSALFYVNTGVGVGPENLMTFFWPKLLILVMMKVLYWAHYSFYMHIITALDFHVSMENYSITTCISVKLSLYSDCMHQFQQGTKTHIHCK